MDEWHPERPEDLAREAGRAKAKVTKIGKGCGACRLPGEPREILLAVLHGHRRSASNAGDPI